MEDYVEPTFGQRLVARVIDAVIVLLPASLLRAGFDGRSRAAVGLVAVAVYEILFVSTRGRTPGKMAMGTRVSDLASGALPTVRQATLRWLTIIAVPILAVAIPALAGLGGVYTIVILAPILRRPLHRGFHDLVAGTVVTALPAAVA